MIKIGKTIGTLSAKGGVCPLLVPKMPHASFLSTKLHTKTPESLSLRQVQLDLAQFEPLLDGLVLSPQDSREKTWSYWTDPNGPQGKKSILERIYKMWCFSVGEEDVFKDWKNILDDKSNGSYHTGRSLFAIMAWASQRVGNDFGDDPPVPRELPPTPPSRKSAAILFTLGKEFVDRIDISKTASDLFAKANHLVKETIEQRKHRFKLKHEALTIQWDHFLKEWNAFVDEKANDFVGLCRHVLVPLVKKLSHHMCKASNSAKTDANSNLTMKLLTAMYDETVKTMEEGVNKIARESQPFRERANSMAYHILGFAQHYASLAITTIWAHLIKLAEAFKDDDDSGDK